MGWIFHLRKPLYFIAIVMLIGKWKNPYRLDVSRAPKCILICHIKRGRVNNNAGQGQKAHRIWLKKKFSWSRDITYVREINQVQIFNVGRGFKDFFTRKPHLKFYQRYLDDAYTFAVVWKFFYLWTAQGVFVVVGFCFCFLFNDRESVFPLNNKKR